MGRLYWEERTNGKSRINQFINQSPIHLAMGSRRTGEEEGSR
jgi:hypothetical protein